MLRVPKRGWTPPSTNSLPSSPPSRWAVLARPSGPAAKERWSRRMPRFCACGYRHPTPGSGFLDVEMNPCPRRSGSAARVCAGRQRASARIGRVQRGRRARPHVRVAVAHQLVVRRLPHEGDQLGLVGDVDGLDGDVRLGVAGAVPVKVVAAGTPAAAVVLADRDLGVRRAVLALDGAERAPDRQLPADVGLGLDRVLAEPEGQRVQRAAGAALPGGGGEVVAVVEDAGLLAVDDRRERLALAVLVDLDPVLRADLAAVWLLLPQVVVEHLDVGRDPLLVVLVGEVRAERAAADIGSDGIDALAALAEDAHEAGRQPGEVAAQHLGLVGRVDELDVRAGEDQVDFGHGPNPTWRHVAG